MRWAYTPLVVRRPSTRTFVSGTAVVGLSSESVPALPTGVRPIAAVPSLRAFEVSGTPAELASLAREVGTGPIRYVEPVSYARYEHQRSDPATYQIDAATGRPYEWPFGEVGVDRAFNVTKGDSRIVVGIVDSGFSQTKDLLGGFSQLWYYSGEGSDAEDVEGHGTFVASIIGARNDDGYGLGGFCGACQLDGFKVVRLSTFNVAGAIEQLVDDGDRIINLSLGFSSAYAVVLDAINYAIAHGVLVVASSGNDSVGALAYPAAWLGGVNGSTPIGLAVGASDRYNARAVFSDFGPNLSLVAPGTWSSTDCTLGVYGALSAAASEFESGGCDRIVTDPANGGRYAYASGTSFSAPEVAGAAALVWAVAPSLTASQVASVLESTARRSASGWDPGVGWGVLDVGAAVAKASGQPTADVVHVSATAGASTYRPGDSASATGSAAWQDGVGVIAGSASCAVTVGGSAVTTSAAINGSAITCSWTVPPTSAGQLGSGTITASDVAGNHGAGSFSFSVQAPAQPPASTGGTPTKSKPTAKKKPAKKKK